MSNLGFIWPLRSLGGRPKLIHFLLWQRPRLGRAAQSVRLWWRLLPQVDVRESECFFLSHTLYTGSPRVPFPQHLATRAPFLPSSDSQSCCEEGSVGRARALYSNTTELEMIWLLKATCRVTRPVSWAARKGKRGQGRVGGGHCSVCCTTQEPGGPLPHAPSLGDPASACSFLEAQT